MPSNAELLARDAQVVIRGWENIAEPTPLLRGQGVIVTDYDGKDYIDCSSGMFCVNVGHSHPAVVQAIQEQATRLIQISGHQTTEATVALAELLSSIAPGDLKRLYFTVGGTETNNVALKLAKSFSGKHEIVALKNAYHGLHGIALSCTGSTSYKKGFGPLEPGVRHAPHPYCYRCPFDLTYPACDLRCARGDRGDRQERRRLGCGRGRRRDGDRRADPGTRRHRPAPGLADPSARDLHPQRAADGGGRGDGRLRTHRPHVGLRPRGRCPGHHGRIQEHRRRDPVGRRADAGGDCRDVPDLRLADLRRQRPGVRRRPGSHAGHPGPEAVGERRQPWAGGWSTACWR